MTTPQSLQFTTPDGEAIPMLRIGPVDVIIGADKGKYPDGNLVVVTGSDSRIVFDTPLTARKTTSLLREADAVVLSHVHEDHTAALDLLADKPLHVHSGDVAAARSIAGLARHYGYSPAVNEELCRRAVERYHFQPRPSAISYSDGAVWDLGGVRVRAIHAPGHTAGHCILMVEPHEIAFIGDIDLSGFGPYYGDATSDLAAFRTSLRNVRAMRANCWITYHHKGVITDRGEFTAQLDRFEAVLQKREDALLNALASGPLSVDDLVAMRFVYPPSFDDVFVPDVERRMILQHLDELAATGLIQQAGGLFLKL